MKFGYSSHAGRNRGHTLPEVMVSVFVVGVLVVSLYAGFSSGFAMLQLAREETRASQILQQKMEVIRLCTWSELASLPQNFQEQFDPLVTTNDPHGIIFKGNIGFERPTLGTSYESDLQLVTVSISWTNLDGEHPVMHSRQLQSQIARYGSQNYNWGSHP